MWGDGSVGRGCPGPQISAPPPPPSQEVSGQQPGSKGPWMLFQCHIPFACHTASKDVSLQTPRYKLDTWGLHGGCTVQYNTKYQARNRAHEVKVLVDGTVKVTKQGKVKKEVMTAACKAMLDTLPTEELEAALAAAVHEGDEEVCQTTHHVLHN